MSGCKEVSSDNYLGVRPVCSINFHVCHGRERHHGPLTLEILIHQWTSWYFRQFEELADRRASPPMSTLQPRTCPPAPAFPDSPLRDQDGSGSADAPLPSPEGPLETRPLPRISTSSLT